MPSLDAQFLGETRLKSNSNPALLSSTYLPNRCETFTTEKETEPKLYLNKLANINYYRFATPLNYGNVYQNDQIIAPTKVENLPTEAYIVSQPYLNTLEKAKFENIEPPNINEISNSLKNYIAQPNVLTNVLNEKVVTIPLNNIGAIQYEPAKFGKVSYLKTDNPDIYLQMWPTAVKIIKAKIVFETDKLQALNFCPIVNYKNTQYTNEEVQRIIEQFVKMHYGEPIIVKTEPDSQNSKPHVVVDNIDESSIKNGTVYIVWANMCHCGCNRIGCQCSFN
nr:uncharacterized protein LOC117995223 [Maniola hyperantus]